MIKVEQKSIFEYLYSNNEIKVDLSEDKDKNFINFLQKLLLLNNLTDIKSELTKLISIEKNKFDELGYSKINGDIQQIIESHTIERAHYYLHRLIKSLTTTKTSRINDLDLTKWKQYDDILTDSLWILNKRDNSGAHNAGYWGNFIPQIPQQLFKRYTKKGDWVLDPFLGSGTTLIECKRMGRNGIGIDLSKEAILLSKQNINKESNEFGINTVIIQSDSISFDYENLLKQLSLRNIQFAILHPPYWDIIKFSDDKRDLSNFDNLDKFIASIGQLAEKIYEILEKNRFMALVIGDKYVKGEWLPLGFLTMNEILKRRFKLKSIIVKNFEDTKGKKNQKELWRYRALVGGFYIFKHEYIFIFQKGK